HQDRPAARGRQDPLSPPWARTCQREEVGVYARAGSNDRFTEDGGFAAIALGDDATGFADEQEPGCQVPGLEVRVKEDVESACSDMRQPKGGGPGDSQRLHAGPDAERQFEEQASAIVVV